jgi:hypothetical protein
VGQFFNPLAPTATTFALNDRQRKPSRSHIKKPFDIRYHAIPPTLQDKIARMNPAPRFSDKPHRIEINLRDVGQLFNTMDPSPFRERDLDQDAEEFIESWAQEFPVSDPVSLIVHLRDWPQGQDPQALITLGIHNHFANCVRLNRLEFRRLMARGRRSLLIGLVFLSSCLIIETQFFPARETSPLFKVLRESLTIGGWVAMWRPLEIYLYEWWPIQKRRKIFEKLAGMPVEVRPEINKKTQQP